MFVGRSDELTAAAEHLTDRVPLLVAGEAGIGKTTLLREAARASGRRVYEGGGLATLAWAGYLALESALGKPLPQGDAAAVAAEVAAQVDGGVLILDDLHWADTQTLAVLPLLSGQIALLGGLRTGDASTAHARAAAEAAGFEFLPLEPLGSAEARMLVRQRRRGLPDRLLERVIERARGNPFLLEELAAGDDRSETLRLALRVRLRRSSLAARQTLALLALLGRPAEPGLLGEEIAELVEAGLVLDEEEHYRLRHELLGEAATAALGAGERRRLHARLARMVDDPGEVARHHQAAGELNQAHMRALEAAEAATSPGERARHLGVAAACASPSAGNELRLEAAAALLEAGEHAQAEQIAAAVEANDPRLIAESLLYRARARWAAGEPDEARALIERGLVLVEGTLLPVEAQLRAQASEFPIWDLNAAVAVQRTREAWELARRAGLHDPRFRCLYGRALYIAGSPKCLEHLAAAVNHARHAGSDDAECEAAAALAGAYHAFGRPAAARRLAGTMVGRARTLNLRGWELQFRFVSAFQQLAHHGAYEAAIAELPLLLQEPGLGPTRDEVAAYLALALADVGRDREATTMLEQSLAATRSGWGRALHLYVRGEVEWIGGRAAGAIAATEACLRTGSALLLPWAAATRAWALADTGGCPEPVSLSFRIPLNAAVEAAAQALSCFNDPERALEAERLFAEAARRCEGLVLREELRCLWAAGEAARRAGAVERARKRLLAVEKRAKVHGLMPLLGRIHQSLRRTGVRRVRPRVASAYGLTAREREVLSFVGSGHTSAEIARRLGLTVGTVDSEVRSAMTKLNASTRIQAALLSAREPARRLESGMPPLIVVEPGSGARAAAVTELSREGWLVREGWDFAQSRAKVAGRRIVFSGVVSEANDAAAALVAAAHGAGLVVELHAEPEVTEPFLEDLRHLGPIEKRQAPGRDRGTPLSLDQDRLLGLLAEGRSIGEAATLLHISRRTAERRLAAARATLGVRTTAEAALVVLETATPTS